MTMNACSHTLTTITPSEHLPVAHPARAHVLPAYVEECLSCGAVNVPEPEVAPAPAYAMPLDITKALRANEALMTVTR